MFCNRLFTICVMKSISIIEQYCKWKTELCPHFEQSGRCKMRDKCVYAHGREELRPIRKLRVCNGILKFGHCSYGEKVWCTMYTFCTLTFALHPVFLFSLTISPKNTLHTLLSQVPVGAFTWGVVHWDRRRSPPLQRTVRSRLAFGLCALSSREQRLAGFARRCVGHWRSGRSWHDRHRHLVQSGVGEHCSDGGLAAPVAREQRRERACISVGSCLPVGARSLIQRERVPIP